MVCRGTVNTVLFQAGCEVELKEIKKGMVALRVETEFNSAA